MIEDTGHDDLWIKMEKYTKCSLKAGLLFLAVHKCIKSWCPARAIILNGEWPNKF